MFFWSHVVCNAVARRAWLAALVPSALIASSPGMKSADVARIAIGPADEMVDAPLVVSGSGFAPHAAIRIGVRFNDEAGNSWSASGVYRADRGGNFNTRRVASTGGTYRGVQPGGLSCSAVPDDSIGAADLVGRIQRERLPTRPVFRSVDAYTASVTLTVNGQRSTQTTVVRRYLAKGILREDVRDHRVVGTYFQPAGPVRGIPVVVVGGAGGGMRAADAMLLANRGHPALAVAYFGYPGLPDQLQSIPLETFADATAWLARRTHVDRVVLFGMSRSTEAVQLVAAHFPKHIAALIANLPSPIVHGPIGPGISPEAPAWTLGGRAVPNFVFPRSAYDRWARTIGGEQFPGMRSVADFPDWRDAVLQRRVGIPYDRIDVPMLVQAGAEDLQWPAARGVDVIVRTMRRLGKGRLVEAHVYPHAGGHSLTTIGVGSAVSSATINPATGRWIAGGGRADGNCRASYASWHAILAFLERMTPKRE